MAEVFIYFTVYKMASHHSNLILYFESLCKQHSTVHSNEKLKYSIYTAHSLESINADYETREEVLLLIGTYGEKDVFHGVKKMASYLKSQIASEQGALPGHDLRHLMYDRFHLTFESYATSQQDYFSAYNFDVDTLSRGLLAEQLAE